MNKLDMLFQLAEDNNIDIEYVNFPSNIHGLYFKDEDIPPAIGINKKIVSDTKVFTCVLAEELGHHFTTVGDCASECYCYSDRLIISKKETLALKWSTEFLMPLNEIIDAVKSSPCSFEEISDKLEVTEQLLLKRFEFISKTKPYIKIDDTTGLVLTSLPNIFLSKLFIT